VIQVTDVVKRYGPNTVLNGATFSIAEAQLTTILGPSGCGKSTMLRCLNRLESFDAGSITIDDVEVLGAPRGTLSAADEDAFVHRVRARVGIVFQNFNLFPHLTALGNVIEAPRTVKPPRARLEEVGRHYLARAGLSGKEHHYPAQLSAAAAASRSRALAMEPAVVVRRTHVGTRPAPRARRGDAAARPRRPQEDAGGGVARPRLARAISTR
jgi:ABC-type polar amino acid transport system ATPase subunit